MIRGLIETA